MVTALQSSLFDALEERPVLAPLGGMQRTVLSDGAWVDHLPGWLRGSEPVFDTLAAEAPWRSERRQMYDRVVDVPRLVSWYSADDALPHPP